MSADRFSGSPLVVPLVLLAALLVLGDAGGPPSEAAPSTPQTPATVQRGAGRAGLSPTVLGDLNNDGIVDIRDYAVWRRNFGQPDCGNPADLNVDCIVDIRDYGIWRQNFGQTGPTITPTPTVTATPTTTATPTLPGRAYVANRVTNNVTVIDTSTNTVPGAPIPVGSDPRGLGVDPTVHRAYVANFGSNNVTVIDTTVNTVVGAPILVGSSPFGVGVDPSVHRAYVANSGGNTVTVI